MPVGIGTGVSLGSATLYLFADASGISKGLNQAAKDTAAFERRQAQTAAATQKNAAAKSAMSGALNNQDIALSNTFATLQKRVADQSIATARTIQNAYNIRNKAIAENIRKVGTAEAAAKRAAKNETDALKAVADAQKALDKSIAARAKMKSATPAQKGAATKSINQQQKDLLALQRAADSAAAHMATTLRRRNAVVEAANTKLTQSLNRANAAEKNSVEKLRLRVNEQLRAYRELATQAGPEYQAFVNRVERSGKRLIEAEQNLASRRQQLANAQKARQTAIATGSGVAAAGIAEERANRAVIASMNRLRAARQGHAAAEAAFTNRFITDAAKRTAAANKEANSVIDAQRRENEARRQQGNNAFEQLSGTSVIATAALVGAVKTATSAFGDFEEAMIKAAAISPDLNANLKEFSKTLQELAIQLGKSPTELANALNEVAQAGFEGADAMEITEAASKAAAAGYTDATAAAKPFIGILNAYGLEAEEAEGVSDKLFTAVTEGVFSFADLSSQIGDNISIYQALGKSVDDILASYVVLTKRSNSLSESTTQLNGIMNSFLKPTDALRAAIKAYSGETVEAFVRTHSFAEMLAVTEELIGGNEEAAAKLFPNIRALRGIFGLTSDELADYNDQLSKLKSASAGVGATQRVLAREQEGFNFQMRQATSQMTVMAQALGSTIAPGVLLVIGLIADLAAGIVKLNDITHGAVGGFLGLAAGVALFGFTIIRTISGVSNVISSLKDFIAAQRAVETQAKLTTLSLRAMQLAMTPLGLGIIALAVVGGVLYMRHKQQKEAAQELKKSYEELQSAITSLASRTDLTAGEVKQWQGLSDSVGLYNDAIKQAQENALLAKREMAGLDDGATSTNGAVKRLTRTTYEWVSAVDASGKVLGTSVGTMEDYERFLKDAEIGSDDMAQAQNDLAQILETTGLSFQAVNEYLEPFVIALLSNGPEAAAKFTEAIHYISTHLSEFDQSVIDAQNSIVHLGDALTNTDEFFGTASDAADKFRGDLQSVALEAIAMAKGLNNINDPLLFLQDTLGATGASFSELLLLMDETGKTDINTDDNTKAILETIAAVDKWQKKIDGMNASFAESDAAIGAWQAIISRNADIVGTQADGFAALNDMVRRHALTQEQASDIQEAAIWLNRKAAQGIDDERVAIAKSLPDLAQFVQAHSAAQDKLTATTGEANGFVTAMKDANNQAIIMTAIMLKLASAMDPEAFPEGFFDGFIESIILADPVAAALIDKLGLIPEELKTKYEFELDQGSLDVALKAPTEIEKAIADARREQEAMFASAGGSVDMERADRLAKRVELLGQKLKAINEGTSTDAIDAELLSLDRTIEDTTETTEELATAWTELQSKVNKSSEQMAEDAAAAAEGVLQETGAILDLQDPVKTLNSLLGTTGLSFDEILLKMNQVGTTGINLDVKQKELLEARVALNDIEEAIAGVDAAISNNNEDFSMWKGRIDTVNQALGVSEETIADYDAQLQANTITEQQYIDLISSSEAEDGYKNLNQLVADGKLERQEADDIIRDGIWLRERAIGGMEDEQAAQARLIPILRDYVEAHDDADGALADLTDGQEGFLAAMSATNSMMALQTYMMLLQLEAMGKLAEGTADNFLDLAGSADPVLQALLRDLGLIEEADPVVDVTFHFPSENTTKIRTQKILDSVPGHIDQSVTVHPTQTAAEAAATPGAKTETEAPEPVKIPAPDTTASDKGMADYQIKVTESGKAAGTAFDTAMQQAITAQSFQIIGAVNGIAGRIAGVGAQMAAVGYAAGVAFDQGMANAINGGFLAVGAAHALGQRTYNALKSAIESDSPSKKTYELGQFFVDGFTNAISDHESYAVNQARSMGMNVSGALQDGLQSAQMDSILFGKPLASVGISQFTPSAYSTVNGGAAPMGAHLAANNVTVITPLRSDEYTQLLTNAERGGSAARFIDELPRAYGVRNGR